MISLCNRYVNSSSQKSTLSSLWNRFVKCCSQFLSSLWNDKCQKTNLTILPLVCPFKIVKFFKNMKSKQCNLLETMTFSDYPKTDQIRKFSLWCICQIFKSDFVKLPLLGLPWQDYIQIERTLIIWLDNFSIPEKYYTWIPVPS